MDLNLTIAQIARLSDAEAFEVLKAFRFPSGIRCVACGHTEVYVYRTRPIFKCKGCGKQFSVFSGTILAGGKLKPRDLLLSIALFAKNPRGISSLSMTRQQKINQKAAWVLCHKLREAILAEHDALRLGGEVEIDGCYIGGYMVRKMVVSRHGKPQRYQQKGKRKVVVCARQRGGRTVTIVVDRESEALFALGRFVLPDATLHADQAHAWDGMKSLHKMMRINHNVAYSANGACTNWAESFFARLRAASRGVYGHISGPYLRAYAAEMAWREDYRNDKLAWVRLGELAMSHNTSQWKGYWQRQGEKTLKPLPALTVIEGGREAA